MLLKANPGSTCVIMESDKNLFGCYLREKSQLHGEVVWPLEECFLEGCRVVGAAGRSSEQAVRDILEEKKLVLAGEGEIDI